MKIALCLSGQARSVDEGHKYWQKNLIDIYDVDVFTHSWYGPVGSKGSNLQRLYLPIQSDYDEPFSASLIRDKYPRVASEQFPAVNTVSMFYSIYRSNLMRKEYTLHTGVEYDVVIRGRFDYALNYSFHFPTLLPSLMEDRYIWVPSDVTNPNGPRDFCADTFAFGSPKVMDKYCNTFNMLDVLYDQGVIMNGEDMLSANLNIYGLTGKNMILCDMNNPFPPGKYNGNYHSIIRDDFTQFNTLRG